jgi:FkbM family methyltransferase
MLLARWSVEHTSFDSLVTAATRPGFYFVQVGANDGVRDDDIRVYVERYKWDGVLVEPLVDVFERLKGNYEGVGGALKFVNAAVVEKPGPVDFWRHPTLSVCSGLGVRTRLQSRAAMQKVVVQGVALRSVLSRLAGLAVDLLQIDVEGYDGEVVRMIPDDLPFPRIVRYEHKHLSNEERFSVERFLKERGYTLFWEKSDTCGYREF